METRRKKDIKTEEVEKTKNGRRSSGKELSPGAWDVKGAKMV